MSRNWKKLYKLERRRRQTGEGILSGVRMEYAILRAQYEQSEHERKYWYNRRCNE